MQKTIYNEKTKMKWDLCTYTHLTDDGSKEIQQVLYLFLKNNIDYDYIWEN